MKSGFSKLLMVLICFSIICITGIPVVSAADASNNSPTISHATPEQNKLINDLWGSDITIGEYMEKVHPEHLVNVPDDVKSKMFQRKMVWPDGKEQNRISDLSPLASLTVRGYIDKVSSSRIDFRGKAKATTTASYIYVESFLMNYGSEVDSTAASDQDTNAVDTGYKMFFWPDDGTYHVEAWGYTITPDLEDSDETGTITIP